MKPKASAIISMRNLHLIALLVSLSASALGQEATLAVVEKISGSVGFYSADGRRVGGVAVSTHPHEMILSPDKRFLYVTDNGILWMTQPGEGGNTISIIDVAARRKVGVIDLGNHRRPHGIDVDPRSGLLAVTIENPDGLLLVDPAGRKVLKKYDVGGEDPHMVLVEPGAEWAYVSNTGSGTLAALHLKTGDVIPIASGPRPQGGIFSPDGKIIYLTNSGGDSISVIDVAKRERVGTIKTGRGPVRIALTPDGRTLVYGLQSGEAVGFVDVASRKEVEQIPLGGPTVSLTMSSDGRVVYSSVQEQDKIFVISVNDRKVLQVIQTPKGSGPDPVIPLL
jgi:YVTN family beta-propeller protein